MPTNLPAEYYEAEERYRAATTPAERIITLEALISTVPKHKGTDKLRADLRRRLSKLKESAETQKGASRHVSAFHIDREGAAQVAVIGPSNVGKSALITALTNASPEVAPSPYTTWRPTPGMMDLDGAQIQLIDTPPLDREYVEPELLDLIRRADLLLLVVDLQAFPIEQLEISMAILLENRIGPEMRPDLAEPGRPTAAKPLFVIANKVDSAENDEDFEVLCELLEHEWPLLPFSAVTGRHMEQLKRTIFDHLQIIRVYAKPPGKEPDMEAPFVMQKGDTVEEFARKVHRDFYHKLKSARIWGSGLFDGQVVSRDHVLKDGDVIELRI
ncbi:MAG: 50S ribosome-binding GTPase [Chloroflexota bacterium]|nr:MAG: 50S ribosome-binding GTPase [Chloroflexota bacterium]